MDKKLKAYKEYITAECGDGKKKASAELIDFHLRMVQHFQHERFIHLIVTMFFALFMMIFFIFFVCLSLLLPASREAALISTATGIITLILFVTTLFYIRHYYLLENGVEELEDVTRRLYGRDFFEEK